MALKYLRDLPDDLLKGIYQHNITYQLKWFDLYEYNYKHGKHDSFVNRQLDMFTKNVKKIERVLKERGIEV